LTEIGDRVASGSTRSGGMASRLDADIDSPRTNAPSATPLRKNCHRQSRFPRSHKRPNQTMRHKEKGHVFRLLRNGRLM
jgi:hypothetical protein